MLKNNTYILPVLKKESDGKELFWSVEVRDNKVFKFSKIGRNGKEKEYAPVKGKRKNINKKNELTEQEDALYTAYSSWKDKSRTGYDPYIPYWDVDGMEENIASKDENISSKEDKCDTPDTISRIVDETIKTINEKEDILYLPMLAQNYSEYKHKVIYPCYVSEKLNGLRCISYKRSGEINLKSRTGKKICFLNKIREELSLLLGEEDYILDGELYNHKDLTFNEINGVVRKTKKPSDKEDLIEYWIFDVILTSTVYPGRMILLEKLKGRAEELKLKRIKFVISIVCRSEKELDELHSSIVKEGFEGSIIRDRDGKYEIDKRSFNLLKRKDFIDSEFLVVGFEDGKGSHEGVVKFICVTKTQEEFKVTMDGTLEKRKDLFNKGGDYIGKMLNVRYQSINENGVPVFGVGKYFRDEDY